MNRQQTYIFISDMDMPIHDYNCERRCGKESLGLREKRNIYIWHFVKVNVHLMFRCVSGSFRLYFPSSCD